jgi:hypothetical protein
MSGRRVHENYIVLRLPDGEMCCGILPASQFYMTICCAPTDFAVLLDGYPTRKPLCLDCLVRLGYKQPKTD